jgi:hypothetical protein
MIRILIFFALVCMSIAVPWPLFILSAVVYAFWYEGVELIVLGFFLDAYLGSMVPWLLLPSAYTLALGGILISAWGLKPLLLIDATENAL